MPETALDELRLSSGYLHNAAIKERMGLATIATTGAQESTVIMKYAARLVAMQFVAKDALAANDSNYITFTLVNRVAGAGSVAMLAATDPNTTKATGGSAIVAYTKRILTLNATPANLVVAVGDTLSIIATVTGTLSGAVTAPSFLLTFAPV